MSRIPVPRSIPADRETPLARITAAMDGVTTWQLDLDADFPPTSPDDALTPQRFALRIGDSGDGELVYLLLEVDDRGRAALAISVPKASADVVRVLREEWTRGGWRGVE